MSSPSLPVGIHAERGRRIATFCGWAVVGLGLAGLVGWQLDSALLTRGHPALPATQPNTNIGFVILGAALLLTCSRRLGWERLGRVPALALVALGAFTLSQDAFGFDLGIDRMLLPDERLSSIRGIPGRMAPATAAAFVALGVSCLLDRRRWIAEVGALLALLLAALGLLGHLFQVEFLYSFASGASMALPTSAGLMLAATGALFQRPDASPLAATLLDRSTGGQQLRRILPALVGVPILLAAVVMGGVRADVWDDRFAGVLQTLGTIIGLVAVTLYAHVSIRRSEVTRVEALASLASSEARYRRTFQHASIGMAHLAPDGRWLRANQRLCEILGYSEEELYQKTYAEVSHLADLELDVRQWELLRRGEIEDYGVERRFITKTGEEIHADVRLVREQAVDEELHHIILVLQDITSRKLSENTLRVYGRALAATQNGVVITDTSLPDNPIVYANAAFLALSGYDEDEVIGQNCRFLNRRARDQEALRALHRAVERGEGCSVLLRNHRKNGEGFWNQVSIAPVRAENGELTHFVGIQEDVSERVQAEAEREELLESAERSNQLRDRFLSVVSHELRSPLNAILAWTSILKDEHDPPTVERATRAIDASVASQTRLVNDLLDLSRIRAGTLSVEPVPSELGGVLRTAIDQLQPAAEEQGIVLELKLAQPEVHALVDAERLAQVVRNLVENALKFTARGSITVSVAEQSGRCSIEVRDTGRGIPPESLPRIFDEFWQGEGRAHGSRGLGLGLAIVRHLVEQQAGSIEAESEGEGRGACFIVQVPGVGQPARREKDDEADDAAEAVAGGLHGVSVVVVDDDPVAVEGTARAFERQGAGVERAGSVAEALEQIRRATPQILVSDIDMPERDGIDLIREVRALPQPACALLAVAVTGLTGREQQRRVLGAGFDHQLSKPIEPDVVVERVAALWHTAENS